MQNKQKKEAEEGQQPLRECLLVHSSTDADYRQMIRLVFAREVSCFRFFRVHGTLTWTLRSAGLQEAAC